MVNFATGKVSLGQEVDYGGPLIGNALSTMREHMPHIQTGGSNFPPRSPHSSTRFSPLLKLVMKCSSLPLPHIRAVMSELQRLEKPYKRIMLVGGGIGAGCWRVVWNNYSVKLINVISSAAGTGGKSQTIVFFGESGCTKNCWLKNISIKLICSLPSPTMTRPISCPPCLPNVWVRKGDGIDPASRYVDSGPGSVIDITAISPQQATISCCLAMCV